MKRRVRRLAFAVAALLPLGGCFEKEIADRNPLGIIMAIVAAGSGGAGLTVAGASNTTRIDTTKEIYFTASVGGLSGTYDVTISDGDATTYGTFSGTTAVKRGRFITIKDAGSEGLLSMVAALAAEQAGGAVTIEKARAKVTAYQTPGGVEVVYKAKITFKGYVTDGPNMNSKVKGGKLLLAGVYPKPL